MKTKKTNKNPFTAFGSSYSNSFYHPKYEGSKDEITVKVKPVEYKGFLIYERINKICFDVVKDGVCIAMRAGINGAKIFIDKKFGS